MRILFDPELVVPARSSIGEDDYWARLSGWVDDSRPVMNMATFNAFNEVLLTIAQDLTQLPDSVPQPEFWKLIQRFISRVDESANGEHAECVSQLALTYSPILGAARNGSLIGSDFTCNWNSGGVILASDSQCWPSQDYVDSCVGKNHKVYRIDQPNATNLLYFRDALKRDGSSFSVLKDVAFQAFPHLVFHENAWDRLNSLVGPEYENAELVMSHLLVLNDYSAKIWRENQVTVERQRLLSQKGVKASPDSTNDRAKKGYRESRTFTFGENTKIVCDWHTKFRPTSNRIYFGVKDEKIYIGSIVSHL